MTSEEKAHRLAEHLHLALERLESAERRNPRLSENLTPQEARVFKTVGREHRCIMSKVANAICLSLSTCTGLIDRLCAKRLVKRDRSIEDRRIVEVELTDEGRALHKAAVETRVLFARSLLDSLDPREQEQFVALLEKAVEGLKAEA